jgi:VIT1/CCC1 family predicted Fe2+/Mn2+ transporter
MPAVAFPGSRRSLVVGSAVGAAGFSFVAFAAGAAIPILRFFVTRGTAAIVAAAIVVGVALFATGATVGVLAGGSLLRRGLRQLDIGVAAAVVTCWLAAPLRDHDRLAGPGDCRTLSGHTGRDIQRQW